MMLCFLFSALIVALDQFFKLWITRTLEVGDVGLELIPDILGLTRWENDGAMLNILSGQQWLLAGIAFVAALVLVMILLRYNEGFWGTLGLAAVLGGTLGNLTDRVFNNGKVVDMFRTLFINFPIFNIADIFITLGFITFLIHFIAISFKSGKLENVDDEQSDDDYPDVTQETDYDEFPDIDSIISAQPDQDEADMPDLYSPEPQYVKKTPQHPQESQYPPEPQYTPDPTTSILDSYEPIDDVASDTSFSLDELATELELDSLEEYDIDDILREYGFDEDE